MSNWTDNMTTKQIYAARKVLSAELAIASHVQARRSEFSGWVTVEVFIAQRCYTIVMGPKGGVKSKTVELVK